MNIRGLVKFSLVDFPGGISCVIFIGYCNFRCPFCHNPHLVLAPETQPELSQDTVLSFLAERKGKLDAVVVSGGEPTLRPRLPDFLRKVKEYAFHVKLDTNGTNPDVVKNLHRERLIDSLGIDFKAPRSKYHILSGRNILHMFENVFETLRYAVEQKIPLDVRTTVHKALLSFEDLKTMRSELDAIGVSEWTLQQFNPVDVLDESLLEKETYSDNELLQMAQQLGKNTRVRGLHKTI
ncbi:MAG: anaerobic ribonucleoside-triphosphate reductase activating protein [Candidatus Nanoarchaeia archaeon]